MLRPSRQDVIANLLVPKLVRRTGFDSASLEERMRATPDPEPVAVEPGVLASHAGEYQTNEGYRFRVYLEGGRLWLEPTDQAPVPLTALSPNNFYSELLNRRLTVGEAGEFGLGVDGQLFMGKRR